MDVQISHSIYAKVSEVNNLQKNKGGYTADNTRPMQMERGRDHRRKYDARSCALAGEHTAKDEYIQFHGVFKGKKCDDDI